MMLSKWSIADSAHSSFASIKALGRSSPEFFKPSRVSAPRSARAKPFCRGFGLSDAPETLAGRAGGFRTLDEMLHFVEREARGPIVRLDLYNGSMMTTAISLVALAVALFSLFVSAEKFRLDLYNKRFDIYIRTVKFYQAMMKQEKGTFDALQADFIIASRESKFLFSPESGVYDLLSRLNNASFTIIGRRSLPEGIPPEEILKIDKRFTDALDLWNSSMEPLEDLMAPYLNYHYVFPPYAFSPSAMLGWMRRQKR